MKKRFFLAFILIAAAAVAGRQMSHRGAEGLLTTRQEIRESYRFEQGAHIEVRGINGPVEVHTTDGDTAEVEIICTTNSQEALDRQQVFIEHTASSLVVRGERGGWSFWNWLSGDRVRQQVTLTVPRRAELLAKGINGSVKIGELEGPVEVSGVNGRVEMERVAGRAEVRGVNGGVQLSAAQVASDGVEVKGVNGNVEIRLPDSTNADVQVKGLNGGFSCNVPNMTMQEREGRSSMNARIGSGGAPINLKGINGSVRFESLAPDAAR